VQISSLNSAGQQELHDRVVRSGSAQQALSMGTFNKQQALLGGGLNFENPPQKNIRIKFKKKTHSAIIHREKG